MRPGDLIKYKDDNLSPFLPEWGLVTKWTKKHQHKVWILWNTGEHGWEYIRELEPLTMENCNSIVEREKPGWWNRYTQQT